MCFKHGSDWLHGAESSLKIRQSLSYSRISQHFMEPEGSLPCSHEPSTVPYPDPDQSSPYRLIVSKIIHTACVHVPSLISIFLNLGRLSRESLEVQGPAQHFVTTLFLTPSWSSTPCRLSATSSSIYSQLPSIPEGHLLHPQPDDVPCGDDKRPTHLGRGVLQDLVVKYYWTALRKHNIIL
jgi:hypothetical protein